MLQFTGSTKGTKINDARAIGKELFFTLKAYANAGLVEKGLTMKQCMGIANAVEKTGKPWKYEALGYSITRC